VRDPLEWRPVLDPQSKLSRITTFGEDAAGELYIASQDGTIWRFARTS
jgi:hypothetical protein